MTNDLGPDLTSHVPFGAKFLTGVQYYVGVIGFKLNGPIGKREDNFCPKHSDRVVTHSVVSSENQINSAIIRVFSQGSSHDPLSVVDKWAKHIACVCGEGVSKTKVKVHASWSIEVRP